MERYNESYGYWRTLWWLVRRFAASPASILTDLADDWREVLEAIKTVLIALMLLCGPLMIVFTPFIAAWKQYDKRKRATQAAKVENGITQEKQG